MGTLKYGCAVFSAVFALLLIFVPLLIFALPELIEPQSPDAIIAWFSVAILVWLLTPAMIVAAAVAGIVALVTVIIRHCFAAQPSGGKED